MSLRIAQAAASERSSRKASETGWPLPLSGLYARADRAELSGAMAPEIHNWRCDAASLRMRDGYTSQVGTLARQRIRYPFGATPDWIEITQTAMRHRGDVRVRPFPVNVSATTISSNVIIADGEGAPLRCDGTGIQVASFTTDSGKDPAEFDGVFAHHDRLYFWDSSELAFYYGDVGAVMGELTRFPLDRLGNITGTILALHAVTVNASQSTSDMLAIITSTGMILAYEGLDPGDATSWALVARVDTKSSPVSKHAIEPFGPDLWVLTRRGIVSVRDSISEGVLALASSIAAPISDMIVADVDAYGALPGWQMITLPDTLQLVLNVPTSGVTFRQYLYSLETRAWVTASYPARVWHGDGSFTHSNGSLCHVARNAGDNGKAITASFSTSWVRLPRGMSTLAYIIPTIIADGPLTLSVTVLTDHDQTPDMIAEATQTIRIDPDRPGAKVALNEQIAIGATGRVFQARFQVTGINVSFENLVAGLI